MESYKILNPQLELHVINNIKLISYITENNRHINYEDYPLKIFGLLCCKQHTNTLRVQNVESLQLQNGVRIFNRSL
jgi:hypothetical protein